MQMQLLFEKEEKFRCSHIIVQSIICNPPLFFWENKGDYFLELFSLIAILGK